MSDNKKEMEVSEFSVEERFTFLENYVKLIVEKKANSLIVSGDSGLGKSFRITKILKSYEDLPYYLVKGYATSRALYDTLYSHRDKIIIFDDCDSILEDKVAINILKGALDSYDERVISWLAKSTDKSIPLQFDFQGQVIFISNLPLEKFDKAMKSRALVIDIFMTTQEKIEQMSNLVLNAKFLPSISYDAKFRAYNALLAYMHNPNVNFRTLEKACKACDTNNDCSKIVRYIGETA